jgi:hypothetical protein
MEKHVVVMVQFNFVKQVKNVQIMVLQEREIIHLFAPHHMNMKNYQLGQDAVVISVIMPLVLMEVIVV